MIIIYKHIYNIMTSYDIYYIIIYIIIIIYIMI